MKAVIAGNIIREKALLAKTKRAERFFGKALNTENMTHDDHIESREARREQNLARRPADLDEKNRARRMAEKQQAKKDNKK